MCRCRSTETVVAVQHEGVSICFNHAKYVRWHHFTHVYPQTGVRQDCAVENLTRLGLNTSFPDALRGPLQRVSWTRQEVIVFESMLPAEKIKAPADGRWMGTDGMEWNGMEWNGRASVSGPGPGFGRIWHVSHVKSKVLGC